MNRPAENLEVVIANRYGLRPIYEDQVQEDVRRSIHTGWEPFYFDVRLDSNALKALAVKAANNKKGVAKRGPVSVRIRYRKPVNPVARVTMENPE